MAKTVYRRDERKAQFINAGIKLAKKTSLSELAISAVAKETKVTAPLIFHVFGTRSKFHAAVKAEAKKQGVTLAPEAVTPLARKRSIKEVKAIKNKTPRVPKPPKSKPKALTVKKPKVAKAPKKPAFPTLPVPENPAA